MTQSYNVKFGEYFGPSRLCWRGTWLQSGHHACSLAAGHLSTWSWKIYCATGREDRPATYALVTDLFFQLLNRGLWAFLWFGLCKSKFCPNLMTLKKLTWLNRHICCEIIYHRDRQHCCRKKTYRSWRGVAVFIRRYNICRQSKLYKQTWIHAAMLLNILTQTKVW